MADDRMKRAWSFLTISGSRQYGGNTGYEDKPASIYSYDSNVANHLQVQPGDVAVIRSRTGVVGIAEIEAIEQKSGRKESFRCPECGVSNLKQRRTLSPSWACKNRHLFDEPIREFVDIETYEASYGLTFYDCGHLITTDQLNDAVLRPSDQMSIKEIDLSKLERFLITDEMTRAMVNRFVVDMAVEDFAADPGDNHSLIEKRKWVLRQIYARRGQRRFREGLIRRYGARCQVSGCEFLGLLEAAHITPYSATEDNGTRNGLILRSDIHTLFDLGLITVEPASLTIKVAPEVGAAGYAQFDGLPLLINQTTGPSKLVLEERWAFFHT